MWVGMIAFWGLLIWAVYALITSATRRPGSQARGEERHGDDARRILDERLARGEIDAKRTGGCVTCLHPARAAAPLAVGQRAMTAVTPPAPMTGRSASAARRPIPVRNAHSVADASGKEDYLRRLRKIEGQVRGLQKMIEADTWCPDVVLQVGSATRALQEVGRRASQ